MSGTLTHAEPPRPANALAQHAPAQIVKATLQRLAQACLEPTPENYARAWVESGGNIAGSPWASLIEQMLRGLERGGRQWTVARRKAGIERVLAGSRGDAQRLLDRLTQLVAAWDKDDGDAGVEIAVVVPAATDATPLRQAGARLIAQDGAEIAAHPRLQQRIG